MSEIEIRNIELEPTAHGLRICMTLTINRTGQTYPNVCSPEIPWDTIRKAAGDIDREAGRFWKRIKGWFS